MPSQPVGCGPALSPLLQPRSLKAVGLGSPRELVTQEIGAQAPLAMGGSTGQTPLIYAIPCPLNYCHPPLPSSGICGQPAGPGFYVFIMNLCTYVKIFFKIYVPFAYFLVCCGLQVSGGGTRESQSCGCHLSFVSQVGW